MLFRSHRLEVDCALGHSAKDTGSVVGATAHEFGHAVENHLRATGQFTPELQAAVDSEWSRGPSGVSAEVGEYAAKSRQELFAEAFAEYKCSDSPRSAAKTIGVHIDNILREEDINIQ